MIDSSARLLRIEKDSLGGTTTVHLIGYCQVDHIAELEKHLWHTGARCVVDLTDVTLVDVDVVRFLGACEERGIDLVNCSPYIREWIKQERTEKTVR